MTKSNLSKFSADCGNHMVVAVTQGAVNSTMKEYLYRKDVTHSIYNLCVIDGNMRSVYFSVSKNTDYLKIPEIFPPAVRSKDIFKNLEDLQLFKIPSDMKERSQSDIDRLEIAYSIYYMDSAVEIKEGLPSKFTAPEIKTFNPLQLKPSINPLDMGTHYVQCFNEMKVIECKEQHRQRFFNIAVQSESPNPWLYDFNIKFNLESTDYNKLRRDNPGLLQEIAARFKVAEKDIEDLFEISKLILDLKTMSLSGLPNIEGIKTTTDVNIAAAIELYIAEEQAEAFTIGHIVGPSPGNPGNYIFKPKEYTYSVTESPAKNPDLRTLNYIISFTDSKPVPQNYDWEWVTPSQQGDISGIMAFNRDFFFDLVNEDFRKKVLYQLRRKFSTSMEGDHKTIFDVRWVCSTSWNTDEDRTRFVFDSSLNCFKYADYEYCSTAGEISFYIPPVFAGTADFKFKYHFSCTSKWGTMTTAAPGKTLTVPAVIFTVTPVLWADYVYDGGHSEGNVLNETITLSLGLLTDQNGNISFAKDIKTEPGKTGIDFSGWSQFASFGGITDCFDRITKSTREWTSSMTASFRSNFMDNYLGSVNWIMPGRKTFAFKNEEFSDYGDYVSQVTYVQQ